LDVHRRAEPERQPIPQLLYFSRNPLSGEDELNALKLCIEVAGSPENVLYGSDYPHNIGDMTGCLARLNALPLEQRAPIAGKNAERLLRL
jgi:predicted TIM-barrel fold metal-dependent hydrolase